MIFNHKKISSFYRKPATNAFSVRGQPVSEFSPKENQKRVHEKGDRKYSHE
jgi:hypothetical protein